MDTRSLEHDFLWNVTREPDNQNLHGRYALRGVALYVTQGSESTAFVAEL